MPAPNVDFSDREFQDLREITRERGTTMKALVREATAADIARRALKETAEVFRRFFSDPAAEAFPDDEPRGGAPGRAA